MWSVGIVKFRRSFFYLLLAVVSVCAVRAAAPVLLISLDGFRWDYCEKYPEETRTLQRLRATGASAAALISMFPSSTFPNHYSIATGLRPSHHGIINNHFFDPQLGYFHSGRREANTDGRWWGGEPVWITAVKQGRTSACNFWPGSEVACGGLRPTHWKAYDYSIPFARRLDELMGWLKEPQPPAIITFYFAESDTVGHATGPDSPQMAATLKMLDGRIAEILERAKKEALSLNLVIVSDHGMTAVKHDHVLVLNDSLDLDKVQVDFDGAVAGLRPLDGDVDGLMRRLAKLPAPLHAYRKAELPAHLALGENPRQPPVWILADPGWEVEKRSLVNSVKEHLTRGEHGYDPLVADMRGILIVNGPAFRSDGFVAEPIENIHIYNLLCAVAGLTPAPNDGDDRLTREFLAPVLPQR